MWLQSETANTIARGQPGDRVGCLGVSRRGLYGDEIRQQSAAVRLTQFFKGLSFQLSHTFSTQAENIGNFLQSMGMICFESVAQA